MQVAINDFPYREYQLSQLALLAGGGGKLRYEKAPLLVSKFGPGQLAINNIDPLEPSYNSLFYPLLWGVNIIYRKLSRP